MQLNPEYVSALKSTLNNTAIFPVEITRNALLKAVPAQLSQYAQLQSLYSAFQAIIAKDYHLASVDPIYLSRLIPTLPEKEKSKITTDSFANNGALLKYLTKQKSTARAKLFFITALLITGTVLLTLTTIFFGIVLWRKNSDKIKSLRNYIQELKKLEGNVKENKSSYVAQKLTAIKAQERNIEREANDDDHLTSTLSLDVLKKVVRYLPPEDVARASQVSRFFKRACYEQPYPIPYAHRIEPTVVVDRVSPLAMGSVISVSNDITMVYEPNGGCILQHSNGQNITVGQAPGNIYDVFGFNREHFGVYASGKDVFFKLFQVKQGKVHEIGHYTFVQQGEIQFFMAQDLSHVLCQVRQAASTLFYQLPMVNTAQNVTTINDTHALTVAPNMAYIRSKETYYLNSFNQENTGMAAFFDRAELFMDQIQEQRTVRVPNAFQSRYLRGNKYPSLAGVIVKTAAPSTRHPKTNLFISADYSLALVKYADGNADSDVVEIAPAIKGYRVSFDHKIIAALSRYSEQQDELIIYDLEAHEFAAKTFVPKVEFENQLAIKFDIHRNGNIVIDYPDKALVFEYDKIKQAPQSQGASHGM